MPFSTHKFLPWSFVLLMGLMASVLSAPVEQSLQDKLEAEDDMLLLLVPSVPIQKRSTPVSPEKVEYDLIAIPGEVLRKEIRKTGHSYGPLSNQLRPLDQWDRSGASNTVVDSSVSPDQIRRLAQQQKQQEKINQKQLLQQQQQQRNKLLQQINQQQQGQQQQFRYQVQQQQQQQNLAQNQQKSLSGLQNSEASLKENAHDKRSFLPSSSSGSSDNSGSSQDAFRNKIQGATNALRTVGTVVEGVGTVVNTINSFSNGGGAALSAIGGIKSSLANSIGIGGGGSTDRTSTSSSSSSSSSGTKNVLSNVGGALALGGSAVAGLSAILSKLKGRGSGESNGFDSGNNILSGIANFNADGGSGGGLGDIKQLGSGIKDTVSGVTGGLRYVGRLSTSLLRILLQLPGIKARVFTEIVQASTPLKTTISDVISENADDMRAIMEASTEIIRDGFDILIRVISDVLALKGRMIASFSANGLDSGASVFDGGLRIGGAVVQTAGDVAAAVGKGVGEVVQVVSDADVPPLPQLPNLPQIPNLLGLLNLGNKNSEESDTYETFEVGR